MEIVKILEKITIVETKNTTVIIGIPEKIVIVKIKKTEIVKMLEKITIVKIIKKKKMEIVKIIKKKKSLNLTKGEIPVETAETRIETVVEEIKDPDLEIEDQEAEKGREVLVIVIMEKEEKNKVNFVQKNQLQKN